MSIKFSYNYVGRTGPGVCFRLYSEEDFSAMSEYTTPEIRRVSLDSVLLQMIAMGLPNVRKFPFIEPPDSKAIDNSIMALKQHVSIIFVLHVNIKKSKILICICNVSILCIL